MAKQYIAARLKGGSVVHALPLNDEGKGDASKGALCGKKPTRSKTSSMFRSGWYGYKEGTVKITCTACLKIAGGE